MSTDLDLGRAFREAERAARARRMVGPVLFRSTDGWEISGSVMVGNRRRSVRIVNSDLEAALLEFAEQLEAVA